MEKISGEPGPEDGTPEYIMDNQDIYCECATIRGNNNKIHKDGCLVYGDDNTFYGGACVSWGTRNQFYGDGSEVHGKGNVIYGNGCIYHDQNNTIYGQDCIYMEEEPLPEQDRKRTDAPRDIQETPTKRVKFETPQSNPGLPGYSGQSILLSYSVFDGNGMISMGPDCYKHHVCIGQGCEARDDAQGREYRFPNGGSLFIANQELIFAPSREWIHFDHTGAQTRGPIPPQQQGELKTEQEVQPPEEPVKSEEKRTKLLPLRYEPEFNGETSKQLCVVCEKRETACTCKPCGHNVYCVKCSHQISDHWEKKGGRGLLLCPICRKEIEAFAKLL